MARHDALAPRVGMDNYLFTIGFAPGLEIGGRLADFGLNRTNDLSLNAKYAYRFDNGFALALGAQDIGGEARNFRSRYAVATLPWRELRFTAGYDWGPDVLDGAIGGIEWRPWSVLGIYAEYDADEVNPGVRFQSRPLWAGLRLGGNVGYRGAFDQVEGGFEITIPLGRKRVVPSEARDPLSDPSSPPAPRDDTAPVIPSEARDPLSGEHARRSSPPAPRDDTGAALRSALTGLGFESVRTGTRDGVVLVVSLENRRYNHSAADGIGLALGTIATSAAPQVERIELTLTAYGVPQVVVATSPAAYRDFLQGGAAAPDLLDVRYSHGVQGAVRWHNPGRPLEAAELVVEPLLRTYLGTEFGMADAALGVRARFTAPLGRGVVAHLGLQAPLLLTDDFRDGRNFADTGPEAGLDQLLMQYAHKPAASWTSLWSFGLTQVFQTDFRVLGTEQLWTSPQGRHRLHAKLLALSAEESRQVALGGYTWFDVTRRYSASVTGGRFYDEDTGVRIDLMRYFDDTIAGLFLKAESDDNMAGGFQLSLPLTPRRDAMPRGVQVKGARRWGHSKQTTLNRADGTNALRPFMLYEPMMDFDLRRDFLDSDRLAPAWLREQLPRMREAWLLWGA
jgi:hypothetical protein